MIIEIRKAGFINKGAELMLLAILQQIKQRYPDAKIAMVPTTASGGQPFHKFAPLGIFPKFSVRRMGIDLGVLLNIFPATLRERFGIILDKEINVVLDAAGFSYSDQWGEASCRELAISVKNWKKNGAKVILMPQAFGPFLNKKNRNNMAFVMDSADLVFAREEKSYEYLMDISGKHDHVYIAPDFTNILSGTLPEGFDKENCRFAIVPNSRMLDKLGEKERKNYIPFLLAVSECLTERGEKPFILIHEDSDLTVAHEVASKTEMPIISESDPIKIKGIIGACRGMVGSRFHGLVSALSQGVPALAMGWSHKYEMLFNDYDLPEGIFPITESRENLLDRLDDIFAGENYRKKKRNLEEVSKRIKAESMEMWGRVFELIDKV